MKKNVYQAPEMEVVELKSQSVLLAGSDGETAGGGGEGFAPEFVIMDDDINSTN